MDNKAAIGLGVAGAAGLGGAGLLAYRHWQTHKLADFAAATEVQDFDRASAPAGKFLDVGLSINQALRH